MIATVLLSQTRSNRSRRTDRSLASALLIVNIDGRDKYRLILNP